MKTVGIKSVDDLFKLASAPLVESIEMRNALEAALVCSVQHVHAVEVLPKTKCLF